MFRNVRIGARLVAGFFVISLLMGVVCVFSYLGLAKLRVPLTEDIPAELHVIETTSRLDSLAQRIRYYDQQLTEAARNYATSGDGKWKYRYRNFEPQLEENIQESISLGDELGDEKVARFFSDVLKAKSAFVEMEKASISARDESESDKAVRILESGAYWKLKEEYKEGLEAYVESRGKKLGETLEVSAGKVESVVQHTYNVVKKSLRLLVTVTLFSILLGIILGMMLSRSIVRPITLLQKGAEIIGKGFLDYKITLEARDEVGRLAASFNDMTLKLKESYSGLEDKVREKTKELAQKVHEIESARAKDEAILSSIGDGLIATDRKGRVILMNGSAQSMLGVPAREAVGKPISEVVRAKDNEENEIPPELRPVRVVLSGAGGRKLTTTAYYGRKDETFFPVAITVAPITLDDQTIGAIEIFRDITKEKEIDNMKTEFVHTVSHELRTPLTTIREGVAQVLDGILGETTKEQRDFLSISLEDIDRLKRIIDNLLDISKIESGKYELRKEKVDMARLAYGVCAAFQPRIKSQGLTLVQRFPETPVYVYGDRDKLIQVFTNLIGNALKFTEKGKIEVSVTARGNMVDCAVSDTGKGIADEDKTKLFGKFEQFGREYGAGEKGTGLGLSIASGIVGLHKSAIGVTGKLGEGTKFYFSLARYDPEDAFLDHVNPELEEAVKKGKPFSLVLFGIVDRETAKEDIGEEHMSAIMARWEVFIKSKLPHRSDISKATTDTVFSILSGTSKADAVPLAGEIVKESRTFFADEQLNGNLQLSYRVAEFPESGRSDAALAKALRESPPVANE